MPRFRASTRTWALLLFCLAAPACARGAGLQFRGPRLGRSPEQVRAAGFAKRAVVAHPAGAQGEVLDAAALPDVQSLTVYDFREHLFEIAAYFREMPYDDARALSRAVYARYGAPEGLEDGIRVAVRWRWRGVTIHYGVVQYGTKTCAPGLLITDESAYHQVLAEDPVRAFREHGVCTPPCGSW